MNTIQSKIARFKIRRKWYWWHRREIMVERATGFERCARWHIRDGSPSHYEFYSHMANMYRLRAAWYVKKFREKYDK